MLGVKKTLNIVVDYDPSWECEFIEERKRIVEALGTVAKGVEHYGSTSVPGMRAKPILDILVGVSPFSDWMKCSVPLQELGYDYATNAGVPNHHIFGRGRDSSERTHLVHIVEFLGQEWLINIAFRDALRGDALLRRKYIDVKERAVAAAPTGRVKYNELKRAFITEIRTKLNRNDKTL